jgi:quaternary ammonium compound-resistance protein SugE
MAWLLLFVAACIEIAWAIGLKYTDGFKNLLVTAPVIAGMLGSVLLVSIAARTIPIGTAYAVFVGIGASGTALIGILLLGEPANAARVACLATLVASIVGLKLAS